MCKVLYFTDDYNFWSIEKDYIIYWEYDNIAEWSEPIIKIHWFEFCMTYLPVKLFHKKNEKGGMNLHIITNNLLRFEDFGRYEINPIDYLYEEFKKLNYEQTS